MVRRTLLNKRERSGLATSKRTVIGCGDKQYLVAGPQIVKLNLPVLQLLLSTLDLLLQFTTLSIPCIGPLLTLVLAGVGVGWSGGIAVTGRQ